MNGRARWLLEVEADGRVYRWSDLACTVPTASGASLDYPAGLGPLETAAGEELEVEVSDGRVPWPEVAPQLDGRPCILRRWLPGTAWEQAVVYAQGEATGVIFGARHEPAAWRITRPIGSASTRGLQAPDPLARVDGTTWPTAAAHVVGTEGASYPVVFGVPGFRAASTTSEQVVPAPIAQWQAAAAATTYVVVSEDPEAPITQVRVRNDTTGVVGLEDVLRVRDDLGRPVLVAAFTNDAGPLPASADDQMYVGYRPAGGGGVARTVYDVLAYVHRRWGADAVDWSRLPEIRDGVSGYLVDTWIDQPVQDPCGWVDTAILPDLPLEVRIGPRGRYYALKRYVSDRARLIGSLSADRGECSRVSGIGRSGEPINELTAYYRRSRDGEWLARVTVAGAAGLVSKPDQVQPGATNVQEFSLMQSNDCTRSLARYGLRQGESLEVDWTWDTPTVGLILSWRMQRDAVPGLVVEYDVPRGEDLEEGDEVELTDSELGWSSIAAIVDAPPVRGVSTKVRLRLPG
ncbi:MAG: hypothetical protein ABMA64_07075 [Myxococcota bacterium]